MVEEYVASGIQGTTVKPLLLQSEMLGTSGVVSDILQKVFFPKKIRGTEMWLNLGSD